MLHAAKATVVEPAQSRAAAAAETIDFDLLRAELAKLGDALVQALEKRLDQAGHF